MQLILGIIGIIFGFAIWGLIKEFQVPSNNPKQFLKNGRKKDTQKVIVCAGDSHTHGFVGANYIKMLEAQFSNKDYEFVNAGINGNLAWNVLERLDDIIACQPDIVTLLVGTNDVNATFSDEWEENYRNQQNITEKPTLAWYRHNIKEIIARLQNETTAQIAILSLPMLGEILVSETNQKIITYNAFLAKIAEETGITILPLHQRLQTFLSANANPPPYEGKIDLMTRGMFQHHVLRKSWNDISRENGFEVLTDHIHLNTKAAKIISDLIAEIV